MPGIFAVHDAENRRALYQDWVDLTCMRDLQQFERKRTDADLAREILRLCATLEEPTLAEIAKRSKTDSRKVQTHLELLKELFVITELKPHPSGFGKAVYFPFETGLAHYLGAPLKRKLQVWLIAERMSRNAYLDNESSRWFTYRSRAKTRLDLIEEHPTHGLVAYQIFEEEKLKQTQLELIKSFGVKNKGTQLRAFAPLLQTQTVAGVACLPWEKLVS